MTGPRAIVTGSAQGIGAAVARRLAADGFTLLLLDASPDVVDVAKQIGEAGGQAVGRSHDLRDVARAPEVTAAAVDAFGGAVDALVNCAGVSMPRHYDEVSESDWDLILDVNAKGTFFLTAEVAKHMARRGSGAIVSLSSISGKGWRGSSSVPYAASKAALIAMSRQLAMELGGSGVRVNTVCPGITRTPMMENWSAKKAAELGIPVERFVAERVADSALGRVSEAGDIAAMVAFLISPEAANITGQSFNVDGGTVWD